MGLDVLLLSPLQPLAGSVVDAPMRRTVGAHVQVPLLEARSELEALLGERLESLAEGRFPETRARAPTSHRSLTSVTLATHLERAGLRWRALDPGAVELSWWRRELGRARVFEPTAVAISTTFLTSVPWMSQLIALARRTLPSARLLLGGYFYATSARDFLSLDGDVLCVGEGEERLPAIVRSLRDGGSLESIPGLYLRRADGGLSFTGPAPALDFARLPPPDWSLAERIEPAVSLERDVIEANVETQRGCVFRCEFCTYRTLAELERKDVDRALDAIVRSAAPRRGWLFLVDATGTYPHGRWDALLERLIDRGGVHLPLAAYARVSDITDARAALMARAGVGTLFVGQESGDQGILNRMKKATRVEQVGPAMAALSRHGIDAYFSFIHGFPGETPSSLQATRRMIERLNAEHPERPPCVFYNISPFSVMDLSTASTSNEILSTKHFVDYETRGYSAVEVAREVLATIVAVSRVPHAPVLSAVPRWVGLPIGSATSLAFGPERLALHAFLKSVERGTALFAERRISGRRPSRRELEQAKETILSGAEQRLRPSFGGARGRTLALFARRLRAEWVAEAERGVGLLTRSALAAFALRDTADPRAALRIALGSEGPEPKTRTDSPAVQRLAADLIEAALGKKQRVTASRA